MLNSSNQSVKLTYRYNCQVQMYIVKCSKGMVHWNWKQFPKYSVYPGKLEIISSLECVE